MTAVVDTLTNQIECGAKDQNHLSTGTMALSHLVVEVVEGSTVGHTVEAHSSNRTGQIVRVMGMIWTCILVVGNPEHAHFSDEPLKWLLTTPFR